MEGKSKRSMRDFERIGFRLTVVERLILDKKDSLAWKESQLDNCSDFDKASIEEDIVCLKEDIAELEKVTADELAVNPEYKYVREMEIFNVRVFPKHVSIILK